MRDESARRRCPRPSEGRYVAFSVDAATFGVRDWTLTGAPNPLDITGGIPTVVFAAKIPDHQGLELISDVSVELNRESLVITRTGPGLLMKIQAKDWASGGIFQIEPERADGAETVFTHVLADEVFYFDNPNARDRIGERLPRSGILPNGTRVVCDGADPDGRGDGDREDQLRQRLVGQVRRPRQSASGDPDQY